MFGFKKKEKKPLFIEMKNLIMRKGSPFVWRNLFSVMKATQSVPACFPTPMSEKKTYFLFLMMQNIILMRNLSQTQKLTGFSFPGRMLLSKSHEPELLMETP